MKLVITKEKTMKIIDRKNLVYIEHIGFISKFKVWTALFLLIFSAVVFFAPNTILKAAGAYQVNSTLRYIPKKERMVNFMKDSNRNLSEDLAYQLADAILIQEEKYKIPVELQLSLIKKESNFDQYALSTLGALGFYQVMPGIHAEKVFSFYKNGTISTKNIYDPMTNSSLGAQILSDCLHRYHNSVSKALMCYYGSSDAVGSQYSNDILSNAKVIKERIFAINHIIPKS
jgi:soluble lytic murein transglycosylase-like protein